MRRVVSAGLICAVLAGAVPAGAQSRAETLADLRQELTVLYTDLQRLKRELSTTGGVGASGGGTLLQRVDAMEGQMQRLIARSEELEFRIEQIVQDGTNRIGDMEFRLCELEPGCDIGSLGETPRLGGGESFGPVVTPPPVPQDSGTELAVDEQASFDQARAALDSGDMQGAADGFTRFVQTFPVGPLTTQAHFLRGEALKALGQNTDAARAYLEAFSAAPDGPTAPAALFNLGLSLGTLGQTREACVTLGEVQSRFPAAPEAGDAGAALAAMDCS